MDGYAGQQQALQNMSSSKVALSIDVEDWFHGPHITGSDFSFYPDVESFMKTWDKPYDHITRPTALIIALLKEYNIRCTFFIVADVLEYYPGLVESIIDAGHEIGCHSLHHKMSLHTKTKKAFISKDEFEQDTGKSKEKLESVYGKNIIGYRAPGAYIGDWMFESLIKLGFKYDSSVTANSLYNKTDFNTSKISSVPYWIVKNNSKLLEIPWPYFKIGPVRFPTGGGPFLRLFPSWYSIKGIRESLKRGDSVYYWHPYDVNEQSFPELASKNKRRPFFFKKSSKNGEKKMRQIIESFSGKWACCEDIYKKNLTTQS